MNNSCIKVNYQDIKADLITILLLTYQNTPHVF